MFSNRLSFRQAQMRFARDFPQFSDLLAVVIDAAEPEQAQATAAALASRLAADQAV